MNKEFELEIEKATKNLLKLASEKCKNKMSENLFYILSNENEVKVENVEISRKERSSINSTKKPKKIAEIFKELSIIYEKIHDLNLYVFKSKKNKTIIEIRYFLKTELNSEYLKTVINNPATIHCKIPTPPYLKNKDEKFDINWHLGGLIYIWKTFWWKRKIKK
ncbi:MAG TPA: hypothetical protein VLZ83_11030 [Edaphocola sp.]|nr:hypothetical protein [Edaphocola sp.]